MSLRFWTCLGKKKPLRRSPTVAASNDEEQLPTSSSRLCSNFVDPVPVGLGPTSSVSPSSEENEMERRRSQPTLVSQYAKEVTDFSSQYGSETSISYTACNVAGRSNIFPTYGDFTNAGVFRTYGPWWKVVPSRGRLFKTPSTFLSDDYLVLTYEMEVYPVKIEIFETYNPGAVVRILACDTSGTDVDNGKEKWVVLWQGEPEEVRREARKFAPDLITPKFKTNCIRIEFCQKLCDYYTELDCVLLHGTLTYEENVLASGFTRGWMDEGKYDSEGDNYVYLETAIRDLDLSREASASETVSECDAKEGPKGADVASNTNIAEESNVLAKTEEDGREYGGFFSMLPVEAIQLILSFLDLPALCTLSRTCCLMRDQCSDPLLYAELNLQPYWDEVSSQVLKYLKSRCQHLLHLNLSWCGNSNLNVCSFLQDCGKDITTLYLGNCSHVNNETLKCIAVNCPKVQDLDIQGCLKVNSTGILNLLKLNQLTRLVLYRTQVDIHSIISLIRSCPNMEVLNLGSCSRISNYDDVCIELSLHCKKLRTLDLWRARTLTVIGLTALANNCPLLEELDLGWCGELRSNSGCFKHLAEKCKKLKKIFLTANRTICDEDVMAVANNCPDLQQFDILGTRQVSKKAAYSILNSCPQLVLFDVSFCADIDFQTVQQWSEKFPNVAIKKSFQN